MRLGVVLLTLMATTAHAAAEDACVENPGGTALRGLSFERAMDCAEDAYDAGAFDQTLRSSEMALEAAIATGDVKGERMAREKRALTLKEMGRQEESMEDMLAAIEAARAAGDNEGMLQLKSAFQQLFDQPTAGISAPEAQDQDATAGD
ncbi:MAG: hypothetical protein ACFB3T_10640 [Geminicoccaceae bacterium]